MSMYYPESLVWIPEEQAWGHIVGPMGAYYSHVIYEKDGIEREILMENDEFILVEEFEYDTDN